MADTPKPPDQPYIIAYVIGLLIALRLLGALFYIVRRLFWHY